ncbi:kelch repeats protein [Botrytis cinerea]
MAKDKKSKSEDKKKKLAEKKQKQEKKADKKEKTKAQKSKSADDSDNESVDLDSVLAEYAKAQESFLKITEVVCEPPRPRASSTLIASPSNANELFFVRGRDFWHLSPSEREWTRLETKGKSPPARSGHRMTYYKNYIILFGGFQDTSQATKYLSDLWVYDTSNFVWHNPVLPP